MRTRVVTQFFSVFVCSFISSARGTLITFAYDETNIFIAADSRIVKDGKAIDDACKIKQVGPWFMARAGWFETRPSTKTIQDRLVEADPLGLDLPKTVANMKTNIANEFTFLVKANKSLYPETYSNIVGGPGELADVLVCGFKDGKPCIELTFWKLRFENNGDPFVTAELDKFPTAPKGRVFQVLGQNGAIRNAMEKDPRFLLQHPDSAELLRYCAELELRSLPSSDPKQYVGTPIEIIHITNRRVEWIQKSPHCEDILTFETLKKGTGR